MESKDKLRVLLQHWIDHNKGHAEEFEKWRKTAGEEGLSSVADNIADAIARMTEANASLTKALDEVGGPAPEEGHHHHHHHHHH